jgi:acetyl-CoA acetyltransferase family protein
VVFLSGVRTGFGSFGGSLKDLSATDLGVIAGADALARSGVPAAEVDHVVFGNVLQTSAEAPYLARHVGLRIGLPTETPAVTVNRLCGSGFEAVVQGAQQILLGESEVVLAGGTESMSQAPHVVRGARWGLRLGPAPPLEDSLWESLRDAHCGLSMAETAENLGQQYRIGREAVDCFAALSQARAREAWARGDYSDEVVPIPLKDRKTRETRPWAADEHMRPDTTPEGLAKLPPYFRKDGVVTAGNASGITDAAAALLVMSAARARELGHEPLATLGASAEAGVPPEVMGIGPVPALRKLSERNGLGVRDYDLIELNEAFAAQVLACHRELDLPLERLNVNGGAISLGHPIGATGARIVVTLLHEMKRRNARRGLATLCISGGLGLATAFER